MQYTGTDRVHLHVCRKSYTFTHLHVLDRVAVTLLPIITMKSNGDFAALGQWAHHNITRATSMSCACDVMQVQSAIGTGNHSNAVLKEVS